ncbi:MAG: type II toxin-antitoxin system VapC family toxin [Proteobacteria bacterium]|nr:type II toxin-antitoxin system VapC family toxin [Pseudomonadota bacterium]
MRLLLDTHIALWAITDDPKLPAKARALIADTENTVAVSAASVWEIAIKHSLGRANAMPISGTQALKYFHDAGYDLLAVTAAHAAAVERLKLRHADPFDRMLVAQALSEPLTLLTHDKQVADYNAAIILV